MDKYWYFNYLKVVDLTKLRDELVFIFIKYGQNRSVFDYNFSMIFTKDNHSLPCSIPQKANPLTSSRSQTRIIPIRDFVKQNIKMSKNDKHLILPDKFDKLLKLKIKAERLLYPEKKRLKQTNHMNSLGGENNYQFDSGRNFIKQSKQNQKPESKQQNHKQKITLKEVIFNSNIIDLDNGYKSNRNTRNLKTTQVSNRNYRKYKKFSQKQQDELGEVKFSNKLLSTFIKLSGEGKTQKFFTIDQNDDHKAIQINGFKAPFGETVDHFRLKTACQSPNPKNKRQKIYKTITDWC